MSAEIEKNSNASVESMDRPNAAKDLEIIPTGKALGAEVRGVDFSQEIPPETKDALLKAWTDHLVLLFRGQDMTEEQHLTATRIFGAAKVGAASSYFKSAEKKQLMTARFPEISVIHNLDEDGNPVMANESLGSGEVVWHSDNSYVEEPPAGSMLYARIIPPEGGNTCFSNQYLAYETLPEDVRQKIEGRTAVHDASRNSAGILRPGVKLPTKPSEVPGPHHPLVRTHPLSGRKALYLGRRRAYPSQYIDGLPEEESEELLDFLWDHACKDEFVWCHKWRLGDALLWDNRSSMHYREPHAGIHTRVMHRTQIQGEVPM